MNTSNSERRPTSLAEALELRVDAQDAATRARLRAMRERALAKNSRWSWQPRLAWAGGLMAAAASLAMVLLIGPQAEVPPAPVDSADTFILLASEDAEPLEDLELYVWLERNTDEF